MSYVVDVLKDSITERGFRLTTLKVTFPRFILAEFNTHRMFSRNSASSRAISTERRIRAIKEDPFVPERFGKNEKGMQAQEFLDEKEAIDARFVWINAMHAALGSALELAKLGVHKQHVNRIIEPYCWHTVIVSATEWDNFFALRSHSDSPQPEMKRTAMMMEEAINGSQPKTLKGGQWHLPFIGDDELAVLITNGLKLDDIKHVSAGRCARVSYMTHDGTKNPKADVELSKRLLMQHHMSPFEHVARPMVHPDIFFHQNYDTRRCGSDVFAPFLGNFCGWIQFRKEICDEYNYMNVLKQRTEACHGIS